MTPEQIKSKADEIIKGLFKSGVTAGKLKKVALWYCDEIIYLTNKVSDVSGNYFRSSVTNDYVDADVELENWKAIKSFIENNY